MIHTDDEQFLQAMLREHVLSDQVVEEYEIRRTLFSRAGGSGPLGPNALVDLVRFLGLQPVKIDKPVEKVDWRAYPQDGSTRVEAKFFGAWQPGVFLGFVEAGILAVRLDDDEMVKECRPDMVRIADTVSVEPDTPEEPVVDITDLPEDEVVIPGGDGAETFVLEPHMELWVQTGIDEMRDAKFVGPDEDGRVLVRFEGDEDVTSVPQNKLVLK